MARASTTSDTIAKTCDGSSPEKGKSKPVALVKTVVARKTAVVPGSRRAPSMPTTTIKPAAMAIRLMITWSVVKADSDSPTIMAHGLLELRPLGKKDTGPGRSAQRWSGSNAWASRRLAQACPPVVPLRDADARLHCCQHQVAARAAGPRNCAPPCRRVPADLAKD